MKFFVYSNLTPLMQRCYLLMGNIYPVMLAIGKLVSIWPLEGEQLNSDSWSWSSSFHHHYLLQYLHKVLVQVPPENTAVSQVGWNKKINTTKLTYGEEKEKMMLMKIKN